MNARLAIAAAIGFLIAAPAAQARGLESEAGVERSERVSVADAETSQVEASWAAMPEAIDAIASSGVDAGRWAQIELNLGGSRRREVEEVEVERPRRRVVREVEEVERPRRVVREERCRVRVVRRENENTGRVVVRRIRTCD